MLNEEALLLLMILVGCGMVALGTLDLVWPTRSRHPRRRPLPPSDPVRRERTRFVARPERAAAVPVPAPPLAAMPPPEVEPRADLAAVAPVLEARPPVAAAPIVVTSIEPSPAPVEAVEPAADMPAPSVESNGSVADRGFALVNAGRFHEAVALAEASLAASKSSRVSVPTTSAAQEAARLWGIVGRARAGLDDLGGARFAFEEAIALAPGPERLTWERHLIELALAVGRRSIPEAGGEPRPEHVETLNAAIEWLERGLDVAPDDGDLRATLAAAHDALWPTHEAIVKDLVQRGAFAEARAMLADLVADPECPGERKAAFRRLLGRTMGGEAAQATAEASTHLQRGRVDEAMAALVRAQGLIEAIAPDVLAPRRRQELERRLWAGYFTLGASRFDAGTPEAALDPLFRAMSLGEIGGERREEARGLLATVLGEIVDTRTDEIRRLLDAGNTSAAALHGEELRSLLRTAVKHGLAEDQLAAAFDTLRALFETKTSWGRSRSE